MLGTNNVRTENMKVENLCGSQKYGQVLHEEEAASLFWKQKNLTKILF
jgi:hypothetical protein